MFFDKPISDLVNTLSERQKKYASDENPFQNFEITALLSDRRVIESIAFNIFQKVARLKAGFENHKDEKLYDTFLDLAGYCIIAMAYLSKESYMYKYLEINNESYELGDVFIVETDNYELGDAYHIDELKFKEDVKYKILTESDLYELEDVKVVFTRNDVLIKIISLIDYLKGEKDV